MADRLSELKEELIRTALRQVERTLAQRAIPLAQGLPLVGPGRTVAAEAGTTGEFLTGYDGSVTVMPFMLNYSLLGGTDVLTQAAFLLGHSQLGGLDVLE